MQTYLLTIYAPEQPTHRETITAPSLAAARAELAARYPEHRPRTVSSSRRHECLVFSARDPLQTPQQVRLPR